MGTREGLTWVLQPGLGELRRAVVVALHGAEVRAGGVAAHGVDVWISQGPGKGGRRTVGAVVLGMTCRM